MATNYVQEGKVMEFTAGSALSSGDVVVIGGLIGVVVADVANGAQGQAAVEGVFNLPKVDAAVIAAGEQVIYDVSAGEIDDSSATPASGDIVKAGIAFEAKGATTGETIAVKINAGQSTITA